MICLLIIIISSISCLKSVSAFISPAVLPFTALHRRTSTGSIPPTSPSNHKSTTITGTSCGCSKPSRGAEELSLDQFDFASLKGWDEFYRQLETPLPLPTPTPTANADKDTQELSDDGVFEFEWHSSISHSSIISEIDIGSKVLFVGTGNSNLPRQLYDAHAHAHANANGGKTEVACMDYSQPCIDMLQSLHRTECPRMTFACGDATDLVRTLERQGIDADSSFDYIVDKGLMDAMMCGEGWDSSDDGTGCGGVLQYLTEAKRALKSGGTFVLVSYKLSAATRDYLQGVGASLGIRWTLDIGDKSNERVSFSLGQCL